MRTPAKIPLALARTAPPLPTALNARVVRGTRYGTAIRVSYCFSSLSTGKRRPAVLRITVDNIQDNLTPIGFPWQVKARCATVEQPVAKLKPPYEVRYETENAQGVRSPQRKLKIPLRP